MCVCRISRQGPKYLSAKRAFEKIVYNGTFDGDEDNDEDDVLLSDVRRLSSTGLFRVTVLE